MTNDELLEALRASGIGSDQVTDDEAQTLMASVLRLYNRYRPQADYSYVTTVAYQHKYSVDPNVASIIDVLWKPDSSSEVIDSVMSELEVIATEFHYPSLVKMYYMKRDELSEVTDGDWKWDGEQIWLIPWPTQDDVKVPYLYTKPWGSIADVPIVDEELLVEAMVALAMRHVAYNRMGSGGWRAGSYEVSGGAIRDEIASARMAYNDICLKLAGGAIAGRT